MKLIVFGDSFVEGLLKNPTRSTPEEGHKISFAARLGEMLGREVVNLSMTGSSNDGVAYNVYKWLRDRTDTDEEVFVLVVWSSLYRIMTYNKSLDRMDYANDNAITREFYFTNEMFIAATHALLKSKNINHLMTQSFLNHLGFKYPHVTSQQDTMPFYIEWGALHNTLYDIIDNKWLATDAWVPIQNHHDTIHTSDLIAECQHPTPLGHIKIAETLLPYIERKIYGNDDPFDPFIYH